MKKVILVTIYLIFLSLISLTNTVPTTITEESIETIRHYDLDLDGMEELIHIRSSLVTLEDGVTNIFINDQKTPELTLKGYFENSRVYDIKKGLRVLEIAVTTGKSINSVIYKYEKSKLVRIPVSTEKAPSFEGVVSRNYPEFKDVDNDGVMELVVYYRHFPFEKERTVELYKFNDDIFQKYLEYEEVTEEVYL